MYIIIKICFWAWIICNSLELIIFCFVFYQKFNIFYFFFLLICEYILHIHHTYNSNNKGKNKYHLNNNNNINWLYCERYDMAVLFYL